MATFLSLLAIPAAAGAAWGGVKAGLDEKVDTLGERLASVEAETANLKERISGVGRIKG